MLKKQTNDSPELLFGQRLRLERERRRITLDSISANTKINLALLKGLESDDVSRWPSGIFRRSFIREYAVAIGLDPDKTTREFLDRFPDPSELPTSPPVTPVRTSEDRVLRLTLADADSGFVRGRVLAGAWRRWAAVGWDLAACLTIGGVLFLALDQWWKTLAVTMMAYYASSILLLGNTPGVFFFAPLPAREKPRLTVSSAAAILRRVLAQMRQRLRLARVNAPAPLRRKPEPPVARPTQNRMHAVAARTAHATESAHSAEDLLARSRAGVGMPRTS